MIKRRLFLAAPIDERALQQQAEAQAEIFRGRLPSAEELRALSARESIELATAVFYAAVRRHPRHRAFIDMLDQLPDPKTGRTYTSKLLVVPGLFYREHPEIGADGRLVVEIARRCGLLAELLPSDSRGGVVDNARVLAEYLAAERTKNLWLLSLSIGGAQVRYWYEQLAGAGDGPISGWINIGGLVRGTPLADRKLASAPARLLHRVLYAAVGLSYRGLRDIAAASTLWRGSFSPPVKVINVVGAPLPSHVQPWLDKRYERLRPFGPNDGVAPLASMLVDGGHVYPVWGADHFMRLPAMSALIYKLCAYIQSEEVGSSFTTTARKEDLCVG